MAKLKRTARRSIKKKDRRLNADRTVAKGAGREPSGAPRAGGYWSSSKSTRGGRSSRAGRETECLPGELHDGQKGGKSRLQNGAGPLGLMHASRKGDAIT